MKNEFGHRLNNYPYYDVNLSLTHEDFSCRVLFFNMVRVLVIFSHPV